MKYFDKDFFKFTLGFLAIVCLSLLIIIFITAYAEEAEAAGEIDKIVFTTSPQSIKPGTLSEPITIQAQNSNGESMQTPETIDLEFVSSSATGEFLGSTGNPVTKTMNKNTANRTFYYRDSSVGTFVITLNATGRDSGLKWSANQEITISQNASAPQDQEENDDDDNQNTASQNSSNSNSSHSGSGIMIVSDLDPEFVVSAGSDRLTSVGSPINFQAIVKKNNLAGRAVSFVWSFGDGSQATGPLVSHSYHYPGTYVVVLNAKAGDFGSVSRFNVKVIEPQISVEIKSDSIKIHNLSESEINLYNWKAINQDRGFVFPQDTIILPGASVSFPKIITRLDPAASPLVIKDSIGNVVFGHTQSNQNTVSDLSAIALKVTEAKEKLLSLEKQATKAGIIVKKQVINPKTNLAAVVAVVEEVDIAEESSSTSTVIYESEVKKSFFQQIWVRLANVFK